MGADLLQGHLVVRDIERWCLRKGRRGGTAPVLAVIFFDTDPSAEDYVRIKAHVAEKAGVGYWVYEMSPDASCAQVQTQIRALNENARVHGILVQRPLPEHLGEPKVMAAIDPRKHVEEYRDGRASNIAADAVGRLLSSHGRRGALRRSAVHVAGAGNIVTDGFTAHMRRRYPWVSASPGLRQLVAAEHGGRPVVLITELHRGAGHVTPGMVRPEVRIVIDLGFYLSRGGVAAGDLDHAVLAMDGLAVAPTPGGVLPILPWLMMERTIRAARRLAREETGPGCACQ
ncbi:methenyltetrahydrofolate cyclohydrolase [Metarhizium album ARSEF 1941]|uniref:Methenyltetrahydrofolate cyclohydrolase n=1 Tax=Metarhizium album (strain ARSEF 1941) TaxID=1081103 RepID=A0A0B2WR01_METAS|nr:methenyltetrahydrofolate cyclohydrolase [Metarhizium album ARSEF 1941]KHN96438.1 methenyltetrahydrofolate cyclohydrolase [Metarhizium album ARSEF 1941]